MTKSIPALAVVLSVSNPLSAQDGPNNDDKEQADRINTGAAYPIYIDSHAIC